MQVSKAAKMTATKCNQTPQDPPKNDRAIEAEIKPDTSRELEVAKAFASLANRLVALRKIFDDLKPHEVVALQDWLEDLQPPQHSTAHKPKAKQ
jgi:hypothetical protein